MNEIRAVRYAPADGGAARLARFDDEALVDAGPAPERGLVPAGDTWAAVEAADGPRLAAADARVLAPLRPGKIVAVGLNYRDHAEESGATPPERPLLFAKWVSAVVGPGEEIVIRDEAEQVDWEAELALVVGTRFGPGDDPARALAAVGGYTAINDVSARAVQLGDGQWTRGKSFDTFAPLGPAVVRARDGLDWSALPVRCRLNGETVQDGNTADLIFGVEEIVRFIGTRITLEPGDVIATGTPAGVGMGRSPQRFLRAGDVVEVEVGDAGVLRNPVRGGA